MSGSYWAHALGGGQKHPSICMCSPIFLSLFSDPLLWRKKLQSPKHPTIIGYLRTRWSYRVNWWGKNMTSKMMGTLNLGFTTVIPYNNKTLKVNIINESLEYQITILQILHVNLFPNNKFWAKVDFYNTDYL